MPTSKSPDAVMHFPEVPLPESNINQAPSEKSEEATSSVTVKYIACVLIIK